MRDKIVSMVSNRVAMMEGPVPMDIGNLGHEPESLEVDAVGINTQCHQCGGWDICAHSAHRKEKARVKVFRLNLLPALERATEKATKELASLAAK